MSDQDDDESVGYGRPPRQHRFKPGASGNRKGRPKGHRPMTAITSDELSRKVPVTIGGRRTLIEVRVFMMRRLVEMAAKGDLKALALVMRLDEQAPPMGLQEPLGDAEAENILKRFFERSGARIDDKTDES